MNKLAVFLKVLKGRTWVNNKYKLAVLYSLLAGVFIAAILAYVAGEYMQGYYREYVIMCGGLFIGLGGGVGIALMILNDKGLLK